MTTKNTRLKLVPKSSTKATPIEAPDDVCKDCRAAEALVKNPTLAPPPGSFLHYLVTLPRPLSRAQGRDQIEELSALASKDKGLYEQCAEFQDWGPFAVHRHFV